MVNSKIIPNDPHPASQYNLLSNHLKEMEAICYGVYFEILVEPKEENKKSEGKCYIIKYETDEAAKESIVTLKDQVDRLHKLQSYYTKMLEKANELFAKAKQEYNDADFKVSLVKRRSFVFSNLHYILTEPQIIIRRLENRRQALEKKVCDDDFFDAAVDPGKVEGKKGEQKVFELKEMRTPYKNKLSTYMSSGCKTEELYQTTQF